MFESHSRKWVQFFESYSRKRVQFCVSYWKKKSSILRVELKKANWKKVQFFKSYWKKKTRALVFDKLFARPRADPRVLFHTLLRSSAALPRRCAGWSAGLTSATCVPSSHCAWRSFCFPRTLVILLWWSAWVRMRSCFACFAPASGSWSRRSCVATLRSCRRCAWPRASWSVGTSRRRLAFADWPVRMSGGACYWWSFLLLPCLCYPRSKNDRLRVRSPLTKPIAEPPGRRSCAPPSCSLWAAPAASMHWFIWSSWLSWLRWCLLLASLDRLVNRPVVSLRLFVHSSCARLHYRGSMSSLGLLHPVSHGSDSSWDCRRVIRRISPSEFDRHDPSVLRGLGALDDRILSLCLGLPLLWELHLFFIERYGAFLRPVHVAKRCVTLFLDVLLHVLHLGPSSFRMAWLVFFGYALLPYPVPWLK